MGRSLLLLVSGFLIIFGIIQNAVQNHEEVLAERSPQYYYQEQSRNIAGAMLEIALGNVNEGNNYLTTAVMSHINEDEIDMLGGTGRIVSITPSNFNTTLRVKITGEIRKPDNKTAITTIDAVFNRKAFSIYAYFTNTEPSNYVFVTGDEFNGPVHTNGRFNFLGDPVFNGPITSHEGVYDYNGNSNPQYNDAHDFDAPFVKLPTEAPEAINLAKTENGGIGQFNQEITLEFHKRGAGHSNHDEDDDDNEHGFTPNENNDGTVDIKLQDGRKITYNLSEFNGVISSTENVNVKGEVDGQVTVHSEKEVHITGDLVYENRNYDDKSKTISDDLLGIISGGDTVIDKNAEYVNVVKKTGNDDQGNGEDNGNGFGLNKNKDIYVNASILTMNGRFMAEDFNKRGRNRGTVHLLGGAIQRNAGAMGLVNGSNGNHLGGYSKNNWEYDTRFTKNSTPGFPRKRHFEIESWRESTTTEPTNN